MARLTAADRRAEPASDFAGPHRSFPIPDKGHARAALQDLPKAKNLSGAEREHIAARAHAELADRHLAMHAHHQALAVHHNAKGEKEVASHHHEIAGHHMHAAKAHHEIAESYEGAAADQRQDARGQRETGMIAAQYERSPRDKREDAAGAKGGDDPLARGAANQLHKKGLIDADTHADIHAKIGGGAPAPAPAMAAKPMPRRPFGSLAGGGKMTMGAGANSPDEMLPGGY